MERDSSAPRLDGTHILLVEDEEDVRRTLTTLLTIEGAEVTSTGSGRHALEIAASSTFDVLLTDLDLPDVPGDAIIRQVLAGPRPARVIVVTGSGEADLSRARQAGAQILLLKPIDWTSLITQVRAASSLPRDGGPALSDAHDSSPSHPDADAQGRDPTQAGRAATITSRIE